MHLKGILLPFTTPFTENEEIDTAALQANLKKWNNTGISGYVALGSTGERVNLNESEYQMVVEASRQEVPSDLTFIVGVGQQSTRQTIEEVKRVASMGADAVLAITPSFYRPAITQASLLSHYQAIADTATVPVILYSMPDLTGVVIEPDTVAKLSAHPNIVGIKDSSSDIARFRRTRELTHEEFEVITGNGTVLLDALQAGARAAILAVGCVVPQQCLEIYHLVTSGQMESAASLQARLTPLALAVTKRYGIGGLKAAMDLVEYKGGPVRAPLRSPSADEQREIRDLLNAVTGNNVGKQEWSEPHPA